LAEKVPLDIEILAKQHRGSFLMGHPVDSELKNICAIKMFKYFSATCDRLVSQWFSMTTIDYYV